LRNHQRLTFSTPINNLTRKQLLGKCRDLHGICYSTKNKSELIKIIENKVSNIIVDTKIDYIKPLIKLVGGKTQIIDTIIDNFPKEINNYHELFLGGGIIIFIKN
jgi:hypothetical protein